MPKRAKSGAVPVKPIEQYEHKKEKRLNNPPVGLVDAHTDNGGFKKKEYRYDPHIDPQLQWAGKAEHTSFEVPTVSLHVHERIDPRRIIETVKKKETGPVQLSLFEEEKKPLREAIEFYKHKENWSNRLIAGDSLLVMNSLLEKEGMGGKVQMIYFDPPYGIKYGSNFQPFVNKRDVKDGKDEDLTAEPEMIKAFRDTWELGIHSYLTYLRDRLLLARELLHESGSVFVQISDENVHLVKNLMEEAFSKNNYVGTVVLKTRSTSTSKFLSTLNDYLIWFAKDKDKIKYRDLFEEKAVDYDRFSMYQDKSGKVANITTIEPEKRDTYKVFSSSSLNSTTGGQSSNIPFQFKGRNFLPADGRSWRCSIEGLKNLENKDRIFVQGDSLRYKYYYSDFPYVPITNLWTDQLSEQNKTFVVQTSPEAIKRCMLMSTDPGDLILDITCGSGTTAYVAENWGRRWITCDTSRVAITLAKQRLMTANFDYYQLSYPEEGVDSGFKYKTVPHITLKSIANNEPPPQETLYDQPFIDNKRTRVTGPFTVEAVPAPIVKSFDEMDGLPDDMATADESVSRSSETLRQEEWRQELLKSGVRAKGGKLIQFSRVEPLSGTKYLQAEAETKVETDSKTLFEKKQPALIQQPQHVYVCFGPEYAPLEQRLVELALEEAGHLHPKPEIVLFCAFQFDEEAAKDIDETNWPGITLLKAQMNADLLTDDLKKKRSSNESFWLVGQPDIDMKEIKSGEDKGKYIVEVRGFDYYNPKTGKVDSGGKGDIAGWMLDTDYDGRSLFPSQVFFPMAGEKEGWANLAKNLKAEIDEEKIEGFRGTVSLPFKPGKTVAVKIIDSRGIESLKVIRL
ncbi:MAG: site-specific DNA-methyltransferase [Chitinophagaceae bacterium]|nr:MAG: site-specific DNA-methyltransferase [Chitinophagaceae bacterium]